MICTAVAEMIFAALVFLTPALNFMMKLNIYDFDAVFIEYTRKYNIYFTLFVLVLTSFICAIFIKYKIFDMWFFRRAALIKKMKVSLSNLRHVFHTLKKYSMIIIALENKIEKDYGNPKRIEDLRKTKKTADDFIEQTGSFINIRNGILNSTEKVNVVECINEALLRADAQGGGNSASFVSRTQAERGCEDAVS